MQLLQTVTMSRGKTLKGKCSVRKSRSISFLPSKYTSIEHRSKDRGLRGHDRAWFTYVQFTRCNSPRDKE